MRTSKHLKALIDERPMQLQAIAFELGRDGIWTLQLTQIEWENDETDNETRAYFNL